MSERGLRRGLRRGNWSVQELGRLRALLPRRGVQATATLLRRSPDGVYRKAVEIMSQAPRRGPWSAADADLLCCAWGVVDRRLLGAILGRAPGEVMARAARLRQELRSGPWSHAERHRLKQLYGTRGDDDLVVALQRSRSEIAAMARELCLAKDKRFAAAARARTAAGAALRSMPRWTPAEVELLEEIYASTDNLEVARRLGRTVTSVANKANQRGLRKSADLLRRIGRANVTWRYAGEDSVEDGANAR